MCDKTGCGMDQKQLIDIQAQTKRIYNLLGEVLDLSQQLADALDRNDQVTMSMLLSMRGEPIEKLALARDTIWQQLEDMEMEPAQRMRAILNGAPAQTEQERGLADQVASNNRLLKRVQALDQQLNRKITHEESVYL